MAKTVRKRWPKFVPVLEPRDFVRGRYSTPTRRCLIGWVGLTFEGEPHAHHWSEAACEFMSGVWERLGYGHVEDINLVRSAIITKFDMRQIDFAVAARAWNAEARARGYVVEVPR